MKFAKEVLIIAAIAAGAFILFVVFDTIRSAG